MSAMQERLKSLIQIRKRSCCSLSTILKVARVSYVLIAAVFVGRGVYYGYQEMIKGDILSRQEHKVFDKMRYPSVTLCYKYNDGSKEAMLNYLPIAYEAAKHGGSH